jgi:rhodanese-related sulfurtransferase
MKEITVAELKKRLAAPNRPFLLDVRQPEEYAQSRIEGSKLIPLGELPQRLGELNKSDEIVINCKAGGRSAKACAFLESQGFENVTNLIGGNDQWQAER